MEWIDVASIVFVCVTMNHLGLIGEIEKIWGKAIPILNCPKCATFWVTLCYGMWKMGFFEIPKIPLLLATSFLASYAALWLELFEGYIDSLYMKLYGKIYETSDNPPAADADTGNSAGSVPEL
jgi:hypothetical protein